MQEKRKGILLVLSGPAGVGKGTLGEMLRASDPAVVFSVSATTRSPRPYEQDGVHYHFLTEEAFDALVAEDAFVEYASVHAHRYGTLKSEVLSRLENGQDVLLDIEVQGAAKVREKLPDAVTVFLIPPSFEELSRRLHARGTDSEEKIVQRLETARREAKQIVHYDYVVVNDTVPHAAEEVLAILTAAGCRTERRIHMIEEGV